ncbi:hypothetical protein C0033_06575 [Clostridium sp. chh4-2]|uniref:tripartite tricarboxylate transporter TctB family protein n=1 Tax=Clostridium sp. chh4-2 TaxID=2067550 RepID=UPI000CCF6309|nr:tripartite tricarboxylate transporter TctB family protein [Clostridium sp. chh4-2]PNV62690.1 hypothetical protein C0033_06575 [Clostridium sp. chh4-2]
MKKVNKTYVMGIVCILFSFWIFWETSRIPERLVSNEPGPKLFPYIAASGIFLFSVVSMIFDGSKERKSEGKPYLDAAGWKRTGIILGETVVFALGMKYFGFWLTSMLGMMMFIMTLKGDKKIKTVFAVVLSIVLGTVCYLGFTKGFVIPLPKGEIWSMLGISMI